MGCGKERAAEFEEDRDYLVEKILSTELNRKLAFHCIELMVMLINERLTMNEREQLDSVIRQLSDVLGSLIEVQKSHSYRKIYDALKHITETKYLRMAVRGFK